MCSILEPHRVLGRSSPGSRGTRSLRCPSGTSAFGRRLHTGHPRRSGGARMPYRPTRSIEGTVVAITGASAGIGASVARALVDAGAKVALGARRKERLTALVDELGDE